jgi:tRNA U34 5-methylaminomethyl-2-thiouridine-forming methyltransferase MnmC
LDEHYHSRHGAVQEANHVFIDKGLGYFSALGNQSCRIFEVGFGTGLNALLAAVFAEEHHMQISYSSIELYPIEPTMAMLMNYPTLIGNANAVELYRSIHEGQWEHYIQVSPTFELRKIQGDMKVFESREEQFDLIFFDAFGYRAQSELWDEDVFRGCFDLLRPGGYLTTYASKGIVRRAMQAVGFKVEKLPGPPGKREMVRAQKPTE